ncbi:hypothetical protein C1645_835171, partial [Glomus cerebriforme]
KKQLEALKYYEVVEWIPFDRFNNIESWENNKWSRIYSNEAYCLRIISNISDISEIENQYKVRNTDHRNLSDHVAICGFTKNPENPDYMVVMRYQDVCGQCLWPATKKQWCNSCNSKSLQDEFKNWTSGEFGTALRANWDIAFEIDEDNVIKRYLLVSVCYINM